MAEGLGPPDYVIPTGEIAIVTYPQKKAVGIQFVDPDGKQAFIWIPGGALPALRRMIDRTTAENPSVLRWTPPAQPASKHAEEQQQEQRQRHRDED